MMHTIELNAIPADKLRKSNHELLDVPNGREEPSTAHTAQAKSSNTSKPEAAPAASGDSDHSDNDSLNMEEILKNSEKNNRRPRTMQKIRSSWENGTKTLSRQTASLVNTVGTWTCSVLKTERHDKGERAEDDALSAQSQDEEGKYWGLLEKRGNLAQKMKTLLKIGDGRNVDLEAPEPTVQ